MSLDFDGTGNNLIGTNPSTSDINTAGPITGGMIVYPRSGSSTRFWWTLTNAGTRNRGLTFELRTSKMQMTKLGIGSSGFSTAVTIPAMNEWYCLGYSCDASGVMYAAMYRYSDGSMGSSSDGSGSMNAWVSGDDIHVGGRDDGGFDCDAIMHSIGVYKTNVTTTALMEEFTRQFASRGVFPSADLGWGIHLGHNVSSLAIDPDLSGNGVVMSVGNGSVTRATSGPPAGFPYFGIHGVVSVNPSSAAAALIERPLIHSQAVPRAANY